jgi:DNA-binding NarL/FixJ family response regulator
LACIEACRGVTLRKTDTLFRDFSQTGASQEPLKETALERPTIPTLLVDDYANWRRFVSSTLQNHPNVRVIGEASTGLEAVQKAHELQPGLILMDVGLPTLNGIEAAREIRIISPKTKILFVSLTTSSDIVEEAFRVGAAGFVAKPDVASELVDAVGAVLDGKRFISKSLHDVVVADVEDGRVTKRRRSEAKPPIEMPRVRHELKVYSDDAALVAGFAGVAEDAMKVGRAVVIVATQSHQAGVLRELQGRGIDVHAAMREGTYRALDAAHTLKTIMADGELDSLRCSSFMGEVVAEAAKCATSEHPLVVICGECAPTLLAAGNYDGAIAIEHLWDRLTQTYAADTLCGYLRSVFSHAAAAPIFERICAEHSAVHR